MGDLAFNESFGMLETGKEHWAIHLLNEGMEPLALNCMSCQRMYICRMLTYSVPPWFFRTLTAIPGLAAGYWKFINYCSQKLDKRMAVCKEISLRHSIY